MQSELIGEGSRFSRLFSLQQRSNVFVSNAWPAPAAYHRSFVNTAVHGPALDAISVRAAVVCVPLLLCAGWRQHTDSAVPSLLLKTGNNTPYPCPASEARAPVCPTWITKQLRPFCSWSRVGGNINTFLCCCVLSADGLLSSRVRQQYTI